MTGNRFPPVDGFTLYPAIDLRGGRCVRLYQGDYGQETVYGDDPAQQAAAFEAEGAGVLHVVDLDAARTGEPTNRSVIASICERVSIPVEVGGGVRDRAAALALFDLGVSRVVIGTAALENPDLVAELVGEGYRVAVGLDARDDRVATHGWTQASDRTVAEVAGEFASIGVDAVIVTDIGRDGTQEGADVDGLARLLAATTVPVIASGGVGSVADIGALAAVSVPGPDGARRLSGVIVGRALYEGSFTVAQALAACDPTAADNEEL